MKIDYLLPYLLLNLIIGTFVFLYGFFPLSFSSDDRAEYKDLPTFIDDVPLNQTEYVTQVQRTILLVIDAMRTDFIQNANNASMKHTNKQLDKRKACLFNIQVESPTVTMPRIKAMTTGTVPNFIDVMLNLGSSELKADSLVHQMHDKGGRIVFCGDNTWVKMFPEMFHRKLENEDSLFVNDFYEGDQNITQKLGEELKRRDWKMLILHYLGLDHIGHVEGPFSAKVPGKLKEMDTNIKQIDLAISEWSKKDKLPTILIVTGDHGMRDTGGHGGSSYAEINVPLLVFGVDCSSDGNSFKQIDIAPTLSVLLGLPIPASSIGTLIPGILQKLPNRLQLYALHYNTKRLIEKIIQVQGFDVVQHKEFFIQYEEANREHKSFVQNSIHKEDVAGLKRAKLLYTSSSIEISHQLAKLFNKYDEISIWLGLIYVTMVLGCIIIMTQSTANNIKIITRTALITAISGGFCQYFVCEYTELNLGLGSNFNKYISSAVFATILFGFVNHWRILTNLLATTDGTKIVNNLRSIPIFCWFLFLGTAFHSISLISSSFIEEEHQTWHYFTMTLLLLIYVMEWKNLHRTDRTEKPGRYAKPSKTDAPTLINFVSGKDAVNRFVWFQTNWFFLFALYVVARRLNQTGDKWLSVPDIGDWLIMDEHRLWNSFFVVAALFLLIINCADYGSILTNVLTLTAVILIYYFRTLTGSVYFAGIKQSDATKNCLLLFWLNIFEIFAINFGPILFKILNGNHRRMDYKIALGTLITMFLLTSSLICKSHNIFLTALLIITSAKLSASINALFQPHSAAIRLFIQCSVHYWIGKCFYFYQGNSNSLASIDLTAGYVGLNQFHFAPVVIFLTINTYNGPILAFLLLIYNEFDGNDETPMTKQQQFAQNTKTHTKTIPNILLTLSILTGLPFCIYCFVTVAFRFHIFVWTVFSPKLLYEVYHLVLMSIFYSCTGLIVGNAK